MTVEKFALNQSGEHLARVEEEFLPDGGDVFRVVLPDGNTHVISCDSPMGRLRSTVEQSGTLGIYAQGTYPVREYGTWSYIEQVPYAEVLRSGGQ